MGLVGVEVIAAERAERLRRDGGRGEEGDVEEEGEGVLEPGAPLRLGRLGWRRPFEGEEGDDERDESERRDDRVEKTPARGDEATR